MKPTFVLAILGMLLIGVDRVPQSNSSSQLPATEAIRKILADRIDAQRQGVGIVVGIIEPQGRRIVSHGTMAIDDPRVVGGDSVFEIGSATKVFTSLLLTDAAQRGEVALTDPVSRYLPSDVNVPQRGGKQITLQDLANHTSGLPRLPSKILRRRMRAIHTRTTQRRSCMRFSRARIRHNGDS